MPKFNIDTEAEVNGEKTAKRDVRRPQMPDQNDENDTVDATGESGRVSGFTRELSGWDVYNNEARKVDLELVKDWTASLNFLLLFAAIFAAVLTAFIIESKKMLEPDNTTAMLEVMLFYVNSLSNGTHMSYKPIPFQASPTDVTINCLFFASLSASLVAALASVVSLQWVADYDAAITRGGSSPEDRAKRRQFRHAGVLKWKMGEIIAALPLLLYFSVMLFFGGLILWMWVVNQIVGAVVAGGAAIAVLFYSTSTFLAVAFVSAPFRTPLSRWIYSLSQLPFSAIHWFAQLLHVSTVSPWLERQYLSYTVAHRREDREVENRNELGRDALIWLANQLSISEDSYRRFLLLVGELPTLHPVQMPSFDAKEALWFSIFDLLGRKYLTDTKVEGSSRESRHGMTILHKCYSIPAVQQLVSPVGRRHLEYITDSDRSDYWSQFCRVVEIGNWSPNARTPNGVFLLLRDIPSPSSFSSREMEVTIRLSRWRNAVTKQPVVWNEVFALAQSLPSDFFDPCVVMFAAFSRTRNFYRRECDEETRMYLSIATTVFQIATTRDDLSRHATTSLIQAYEVLLVGRQNIEDSKVAGITVPLRYGKILQMRGNDDCKGHGYIPILLARQINSYDGAERRSRIQELLLMLWLRPSHRILRNWDHLIDQGKLGNLGPGMAMNWIQQVHEFPYIVEILRHLAQVQAEDPTIGPLWRATDAGQVNDPHFVEAIQSLDNLMVLGCTPLDHLALVQLVCQDLEHQDVPNLEGYFTPARLRCIKRLRDPCLQTLASCARGIELKRPSIPANEIVGERKASWERIQRHLLRRYPITNSPDVLELQASLLPATSNLQEAYEEALAKPEFYVGWVLPFILVSDNRKAHLERVFRYPVRCPRCVDGPGHLLFHIWDGYSHEFPMELNLFSGIPLKNRAMPLALLMLCSWYAGQKVSLESLYDDVYKDTLNLVEDSFDDITASEFHLLTLILNVCRTLESGWVYAEDLAAVLVSTQKALRLPHDAESTSILTPLSSSIQRVREVTMSQGARSFAERKVASDESIKTSQLLLSTLASRSIFGRQNARMLSCARSKVEGGPAVGWLPPFEHRGYGGI